VLHIISLKLVRWTSMMAVTLVVFIGHEVSRQRETMTATTMMITIMMIEIMMMNKNV